MARSALELADAARCGEEQVGPSALWRAADSETETRAARIALYGHAMIHAGWIGPKGDADGLTYAACPVCGADLT